MGPYSIDADLSKEEQKCRTVIKHSTPFSYGSIKIANIDGSDFSIDSIQSHMYALGHGA